MAPRRKLCLAERAAIIRAHDVIWQRLTDTIDLQRTQRKACIQRMYDRLPIAPPSAPVDTHVGADLRVASTSSMREIVLLEHSGSAVGIIVTAGGADTRVHVDPHSLAVLKVSRADDRPLKPVSRLHGELLAGAQSSYLEEG